MPLDFGSTLFYFIFGFDMKYLRYLALFLINQPSQTSTHFGGSGLPPLSTSTPNPPGPSNVKKHKVKEEKWLNSQSFHNFQLHNYSFLVKLIITILLKSTEEAIDGFIEPALLSCTYHFCPSRSIAHNHFVKPFRTYHTSTHHQSLGIIWGSNQC